MYHLNRINLRSFHINLQVVFEGIVGGGHQSDIAIDEVKIEKCGQGTGDGCRSLYLLSCQRAAVS